MITNSKVNKAKVNALIWSSETTFMTAGASSVKLWTLTGNNLASKNGSTG